MENGPTTAYSLYALEARGQLFVGAGVEVYSGMIIGEHAKEMKVNSTKSITGHLLGAAGAVEVITCVKELQEGLIHQTVGYKVPDEQCDLDYVGNGNVKMDIKYALTNSLGFGGHNACVIFKKF